jgi:hypothetical protein
MRLFNLRPMNVKYFEESKVVNDVKALVKIQGEEVL